MKSFGTVLDFCWIEFPYGYSYFLWVLLLGEFKRSILIILMLEWILIIIAGCVYIRNKHESANENT